MDKDEVFKVLFKDPCPKGGEHDDEFIRTQYGDSMMIRYGAPKLFKCRKCGRETYKT